MKIIFNNWKSTTDVLFKVSLKKIFGFSKIHRIGLDLSYKPNGTYNYLLKSSPMSLRGPLSSAFCTHRARTSTMFVKKSVKMCSVACQLLARQVASFWNFSVYQLYTQRKITVRFTVFRWDSLITMRNDFHFRNKLNTQSLDIWRCTFFLLKILLTIFLWPTEYFLKISFFIWKYNPFTNGFTNIVL